MIKVYFFLIFFVFIFCAPKNNLNLLQNEKYTFRGYRPLTINSHASEGGFAKPNKKTIIVVYRKDPSFAHISNNSKIVSKISVNGGETWSNERDVYDSPYDDRNLIVGNLPNGNIIVVFRRYDALKDKTIDSGYIISKDEGITWGNYIKIGNIDGRTNQPFGDIINIAPQSSFIIWFENGITKMYSSLDNFESKPTESIIINDSTKIMYEPFLINLKKNKKIILFRNGNGKPGQCSFYQYNSNGNSFYFKGETNIFSDLEYSVRSPVSLRYDSNKDLLEVCTSSRIFTNSEQNTKNELRIYSQKGDSVFNNPKSYKLELKTARPMPSSHWFYGYPKSLAITDDEIIYLITDSKINNLNISPLTHLNNEQANLYTFKIKLKRK